MNECENCTILLPTDSFDRRILIFFTNTFTNLKGRLALGTIIGCLDNMIWLIQVYKERIENGLVKDELKGFRCPRPEKLSLTLASNDRK